MTTTEVCPDATALDQLDFEETCRRCKTPWSEKCGAKADWLVVKDCCGAHTFLCDPHLRSIQPARVCLDCSALQPPTPFKAWRI